MGRRTTNLNQYWFELFFMVLSFVRHKKNVSSLGKALQFSLIGSVQRIIWHICGFFFFFWKFHRCHGTQRALGGTWICLKGTFNSSALSYILLPRRKYLCAGVLYIVAVGTPLHTVIKLYTATVYKTRYFDACCIAINLGAARVWRTL